MNSPKPNRTDFVPSSGGKLDFDDKTFDFDRSFLEITRSPPRRARRDTTMHPSFGANSTIPRHGGIHHFSVRTPGHICASMDLNTPSGLIYPTTPLTCSDLNSLSGFMPPSGNTYSSYPDELYHAQGKTPQPRSYVFPNRPKVPQEGKKSRKI